MNRSAIKHNIPTKNVQPSVGKATNMQGGKVRPIGIGQKKARIRPKKKPVQITGRNKVAGILKEANQRNLRKPKSKRIPTYLTEKATKSLKEHYLD